MVFPFIKYGLNAEFHSSQEGNSRSGGKDSVLGEHLEV